MNTKTIEQLQAEADEAARALAAAQAEAEEKARAAAEAEREQKERERREALRNAPIPAHLVAQREHLVKIADKLRVKIPPHTRIAPHTTVSVSEPQRNVRETERGPDVSFIHPNISVQYRGNNLYMPIEFVAEMESGSTWRRNSTGRTRLRFGNYGEQKSLPPRKDGTYDYDAVADALLSSLIAADSAREAEQAKAANAAPLAALRAEFGLTDYSSVLATSVHRRTAGCTAAAPAGKLFINLKGQVTPEQARAILTAAKAAGLKL